MGNYEDLIVYFRVLLNYIVVPHDIFVIFYSEDKDFETVLKSQV